MPQLRGKVIRVLDDGSLRMKVENGDECEPICDCGNKLVIDFRKFKFHPLIRQEPPPSNQVFTTMDEQRRYSEPYVPGLRAHDLPVGSV